VLNDAQTAATADNSIVLNTKRMMFSFAYNLPICCSIRRFKHTCSHWISLLYLLQTPRDQ